MCPTYRRYRNDMSDQNVVSRTMAKDNVNPYLPDIMVAWNVVNLGRGIDAKHRLEALVVSRVSMNRNLNISNFFLRSPIISVRRFEERPRPKTFANLVCSWNGSLLGMIMSGYGYTQTLHSYCVFAKGS